MKLSAVILSALSVAVLSSCNDKSKREVKPKEQTTQTDTKEQPASQDPSNNCPACGMG
jgi:hypothetical protein